MIETKQGIYRYALGETEVIYKDIKKLYEAEVSSNIEKSKILNEYQNKIYSLHCEKMNLVATLALATSGIEDKELLDTINEVLSKYK